MELEDLKNTWDEIDNRVKGKQDLTLKLFDKISNRKFQSKLYKIILPEILGSLICISSAVFIGLNFDKLDRTTYQIIGMIGILVFVIVTAVSLLSLQNLNKIGDVGKPYVDTLKDFAIQRIKFFKLQKLNLSLGYLQLVIVVLLLPKFFERNGITDSKYFYMFSFSFCFILLLIFSKWVMKSYNTTIRQAEDLLKELSA